MTLYGATFTPFVLLNISKFSRLNLCYGIYSFYHIISATEKLKTKK